MHRLTITALKNLKNDGISINPEDAIILNELAQKTDNISDHKLLNHSGRYVGNVEVFDLSLGAKVWLRTEAKEWFEHDVDMYYACMFYAMAFSRYPDKFIFKNARDCRRVINKWARTINVTEEELIGLGSDNIAENKSEEILKDLYNQILNHPKMINIVPAYNYFNTINTNNTKDEGITPIIAWLISNCGQTAEYWMWEYSWDSIDNLITQTIKQKTDQESIDPRDPSILAFKEFNRKLTEIRNKQNG